MKPLTHAFWPLRILRGCNPNAVVSGFFYCLLRNRPSCRTHNGTGWGTACSVGKYETQARAAKLVPFTERLAGVVAPRSTAEGASRRLGASTKKQRVYMTSKKNKQLIAKLKTKAMKISYKIKYQNTGLLVDINNIKVTSIDFIRSPQWRELRKKAIAKYGSTCVKCGRVGCKKYPINIDHILPRKYYPELALDINNLQPLCGTCNKRKGNKVEPRSPCMPERNLK